jgi:PAS domain S-box-containing protein
MPSTYEQTIMLAEHLRNALDAIPAQTWYATPSGALIFLNEWGADYLGLPEDHPLRLGIDTGAAWDSHIPLLHPDDHVETRRIWSNCLKTGLGGEVTFRVRDAQGRYHWRASRAEPLRASDGTLLFWVGINFDIDELKRAEFYLVEGQRLARTGSWALNSAGFEFWSEQLFEIHGLVSDSGIPSMSEYMNLVHPEDREFVAKEMSQALSNRHRVDFTKRIVRPDGVVRHVRCVGVPDSDGERLVGTGIDVTEQDQLTKALREREEEVREILDLTPQLIAVFGPHLERRYVNRHALSYFGVTLHRWRNMQTSELLHPEDLNGLLSQWADAMTSGAAFETEVRFRKSDGSYRWFLARCNPVRDEDGRILRWYGTCTDIEDRRQAEDRLQRENIALRQEIDQASMFDEIIGSSGALHKLLSQVRKVARSDSTVLVLGETGTGKELIARAIHKSSDRSARPFIGVNCGAIATSLFSSELFGHEKGAFTGATQRRLGRFEIANGGTIFLDEVGDLPSEIQIALLRVLQERTIERVGGNKPISIDVRVVAATHRDLEKLVSEGKFREDLYYRLNVVPITVPALRERAADIPLLVEYFIARFGKKVGKTFKMIERNTLKMLQAYDWPGNVRELQNVIERAVILSEADVFTVEETWLRPAELHPSGTHLSSLLSAREKETIEAALAQSRGRVSGPGGAANMLGVPETTLDSKIKRLGIDKYRFKSQIN